MSAAEHLARSYRLQAQAQREMAAYYRASEYGSPAHKADMAAHSDQSALHYLDLAADLEQPEEPA